MLRGYVCSESVKCDDCLPLTLGDELTLSLAVTLNQDWFIKLDIFVISSQTLACSFRQSNCIHCEKICHCIATKIYFVLLRQRVNFTQRLSQLTPCCVLALMMIKISPQLRLTYDSLSCFFLTGLEASRNENPHCLPSSGVHSMVARKWQELNGVRPQNQVQGVPSWVYPQNLSSVQTAVFLQMHRNCPTNQWSLSKWENNWLTLIVFHGQWAPRSLCNPYKPCDHNLHIGIMIFLHIDNTHSRGYN